MVQTEMGPTAIASHLKVAHYRIVYEGPDPGVVKTSMSNIMFAIAMNPRTGKTVKARYERGGSCVIIGPFRKGQKGIIKLRVEGL